MSLQVMCGCVDPVCLPVEMVMVCFFRSFCGLSRQFMVPNWRILLDLVFV